jgi:hypothetical protein
MSPDLVPHFDEDFEQAGFALKVIVFGAED